MDAGPLVVQGAQGLRQDPGVHGVADVSHAQSAFLAAPKAAAEVLEPVRVPQQGRGLGEEDAAVRGEAQALLAALEQGQAQVLLQLGDLPAQWRLGDVQAIGGPADVFLLGHGHEIAKLSQVKHVRPLGTQVCPSKSWTV